MKTSVGLTAMPWRAALLLGLAVTAGAQEPHPTPVLTVGVKTTVVRVDVVVTGHDGQPVCGLRPEEFEVLEEGRPQAITHFGFIGATPGTCPPGQSAGELREAATPPGEVAASAPGVAPLREPSGRTVVFVVDDLTLASETLVSLRPVLRDLVRRLDPHDRAAILRTGAVPRQVALISDRDALASQVDALRWNPASGRYKTIEPIEFGLEAQVLGAVGLSPKPGAELEKERQVFHAKNALQLLDLLTTGLAAHPGRKAIVLLSDSLKLQPIGRDLFERLGDRANEASVVVYSLDTRGIQSPTMAADDYVTIPGFQRVQQEELVLRDRDFRDGQSGLREIAEQTGGLAFFNTDPRNALDRTLLDTGGYYLIGYSPEARGDGARRLRRLKVKLKAKGYTVRARRAYFG